MALSLKEKAAFILGSAMLATGLFTTLQPPSTTSSEQRAQQQTRHQLDQLSDAEQLEVRRIEEGGQAAGWTEYERRFIPVEPRPAEPRFRFVPR